MCIDKYEYEMLHLLIFGMRKDTKLTGTGG